MHLFTPRRARALPCWAELAAAAAAAARTRHPPRAQAARAGCRMVRQQRWAGSRRRRMLEAAAQLLRSYPSPRHGAVQTELRLLRLLALQAAQTCSSHAGHCSGCSRFRQHDKAAAFTCAKLHRHLQRCCSLQDQQEWCEHAAPGCVRLPRAPRSRQSSRFEPPVSIAGLDLSESIQLGNIHKTRARKRRKRFGSTVVG
jgi:hypothetical protein